MANSGGVLDDAAAVGVSSPGWSVICGPVSCTVSDGVGRYIDCWLDAVPSSSPPPRPSIELAASAPPLTRIPTTTPTPTRAASPEMTGWPSSSFNAEVLPWSGCRGGTTRSFSVRIPQRSNFLAGRAAPIWSDGAMQNPLAKQRALLALRSQAARWLAEYDAALVGRGLGFTPEDLAAVEASH